MRRLSALAVVAAGTALVGCFGLPASAQSTRARGTHITSVTVSGSPAHPLVKIHGHGFGSRPSHHPSCHPGNGNHCGHFSGYDFGTKLFLVEKSGTRFSAGRYRPGLPELDAIGLIIKSYTSSKIVFKLGSGYHNGHGTFGWRLARGDHFKVCVNGKSHSGTADY